MPSAAIPVSSQVSSWSWRSQLRAPVGLAGHGEGWSLKGSEGPGEFYILGQHFFTRYMQMESLPWHLHPPAASGLTRSVQPKREDSGEKRCGAFFQTFQMEMSVNTCLTMEVHSVLRDHRFTPKAQGGPRSPKSRPASHGCTAQFWLGPCSVSGLASHGY